MNSLDRKEGDLEYFSVRRGVETRVAQEWSRILREAIGLKLPPRPLGKYTPPEIGVEDGPGPFEGLE